MSFTKLCVLLFTLTIAGVSSARAACSNASIKGTYGVLSTGLNGSLQPASSLNQVTVDGLGNLTGSATKSINGSIVTFTFTGTYAIASNCVGTVTFTNQSNQTEHDKIYLNSVNATGLFTGGFLVQTDANHVQSSVALAQGAATCTDLAVKHAYTFEATGTDVVKGRQFAIAGRLVLNGTGGITGNETLSLGGMILTSVAVTGSYTVNSDCTANSSVTPTGLSTSHLNLLVVNGGKEMLGIGTDAGSVVTVRLRQ